MTELRFPDYREARKLASRGNLVPLVATLPADLETPVGVYMKLRTRARSDRMERELADMKSKAAMLHTRPPVSTPASVTPPPQEFPE